DAQVFLWLVTKWDPPESWPESLKTGFARYHSTKGAEAGLPETETGLPETEGPSESPTDQKPSSGNLSELAERLYVPDEFLSDTIALLRDRRQIIFYGPPGTGKTYIARELCRFLAPDPSRRTTVQFHPSYSYEDFVHGYRPSETKGAL